MPTNPAQYLPKGRTPGAKNTFHRKVREAFDATFGVLQEEGSNVSLTEWAKRNPDEFYKICAKVIPARVEGDTPDQLQVTVLTGVPRTTDGSDDDLA